MSRRNDNEEKNLSNPTKDRTGDESEFESKESSGVLPRVEAENRKREREEADEEEVDEEEVEVDEADEENNLGEMEDGSMLKKMQQYKMIPRFVIVISNKDTRSQRMIMDNLTEMDLRQLRTFVNKSFPDARDVIDAYMTEKSIPIKAKRVKKAGESSVSSRTDGYGYRSAMAAAQRKSESALPPELLEEVILQRLESRRNAREAAQNEGKFFYKISKKRARVEEEDLKFAAVIDNLKLNKEEDSQQSTSEQSEEYSLFAQMLEEFLLLMKKFSPEDRSKEVLKVAKAKYVGPKAKVTASPTPRPLPSPRRSPAPHLPLSVQTPSPQGAVVLPTPRRSPAPHLSLSVQIPSPRGAVVLPIPQQPQRVFTDNDFRNIGQYYVAQLMQAGDGEKLATIKAMAEGFVIGVRHATVQSTDGYLGSSSSSSSLDIRGLSNFSLTGSSGISEEKHEQKKTSPPADPFGMLLQHASSVRQLEKSPLSSRTSSSLIATVSRNNQNAALLTPPTPTKTPDKSS